MKWIQENLAAMRRRRDKSLLRAVCRESHRTGGMAPALRCRSECAGMV